MGYMPSLPCGALLACPEYPPRRVHLLTGHLGTICINHKCTWTVIIGTTSSCDVVVDEMENESVELGVFPHQSGWRLTSMTGSDILDSSGLSTRSTPLEPKRTVFAGALTLSILPIETQATPIVRHLSTSNELLVDQSMIPSLDLEQAARSGRERRPDRPNAA